MVMITAGHIVRFPPGDSEDHMCADGKIATGG
jgi:hypothetical protein